MQSINNKIKNLRTKAHKKICLFIKIMKIKQLYEDFVYWKSLLCNTMDISDFITSDSEWKNFITWKLYMRKQAISMKKIIAIQKIPGKYYDVTVTSYGGAGSTLILRFLHKNRFISNHFENGDCIKHIGFPPKHLAKRYIYIFANPIESLLSLYRRHAETKPGIAYHCRMMNLDLQPKIFISPAENLRKYVEEREDRFLFERQFNNWFNACLHSPVLFIRYERLWDNLEVLFDFIELHDIGARNSFPKYQPRKNTVDTVPVDILDGLEKMYGKFAEKLNTLPDYILCKPHSSAKVTISADNPSVARKNPQAHT